MTALEQCLREEGMLIRVEYRALPDQRQIPVYFCDGNKLWEFDSRVALGGGFVTAPTECGPAIVCDNSVAQMLDKDLVEFIIGHELGHAFHRHLETIEDEVGGVLDSDKAELEADAFSLGLGNNLPTMDQVVQMIHLATRYESIEGLEAIVRENLKFRFPN